MPAFEYPSKDAFAEMLQTLPHNEIIDKYIFVKETPFAFKDRKKGYEFLVNHIAKSLQLNSDCVTLVGSGRIGFSLSPRQFGTPFSPRSDLDIAIVDSALFDGAWLDMTGLGARFARLDRDVQQWVNEHRINNVYWGYIEPHKLQGAVSCYKGWFPTFATLSQYEYFAARDISGRLYRTWEHARCHQRYTFSKILRTIAS